MDLAAFNGSAKYLGKTDVNEMGITLTISGFGVEKFQDGREKPYVTWAEGAKPMLLNRNNINRLKVIIGSTNTAAMIGRRVQVFTDPMVEMQGQLVGGLRIRPVPEYVNTQAGQNTPMQQVGQGITAQYQPAPQQNKKEFNDDIPF